MCIVQCMELDRERELAHESPREELVEVGAVIMIVVGKNEYWACDKLNPA